MKNLMIALLLLSLLSSSCGLAAVGAGVATASHAKDKGKKQENWVTRNYPFPEMDVWTAALWVCEGQAYPVKVQDAAHRYIETDWKVHGYSDSMEFRNQIKQYGSPIDAGGIRWDGMKRRFLVFLVQINPNETKVRIRADLRCRSSSGSGSWRWWNSTGALEEIFLDNLEVRLKQVSSR